MWLRLAWRGFRRFSLAMGTFAGTFSSRKARRRIVSGDLSFRQIAVAGGVVQPISDVAEPRILAELYGVTEDGKVYHLTKDGWSPVMMNVTVKTGNQ